MVPFFAGQQLVGKKNDFAMTAEEYEKSYRIQT